METGTVGVSHTQCFRESASGPGKPKEGIDTERDKVEIQFSNLGTGKIDSW